MLTAYARLRAAMKEMVREGWSVRYDLRRGSEEEHATLLPDWPSLEETKRFEPAQTQETRS